MDNKDLITRFAEDCFRFEALHEEIDSLIAEVDSEVLTYEYVDLANQAAEIVLKLSANGDNLGLNFYRYYVERLEYIIDYFRALLDYEETPLAEDEQDELDDEPAAEVDDENDTQAAESDEAADDTAAGAPLPLEEKPCTSVKLFGLDSLSSEDSARAQDTVAMWYGMDEITWQNSFGGKESTAAEILRAKESCFDELELVMNIGEKDEILIAEQTIRKTINEAIDAIPGFRDSEEFKKLIEQLPTYNEIEQ